MTAHGKPVDIDPDTSDIFLCPELLVVVARPGRWKYGALTAGNLRYLFVLVCS